MGEGLCSTRDVEIIMRRRRGGGLKGVVSRVPDRISSEITKFIFGHRSLHNKLRYFHPVRFFGAMRRRDEKDTEDKRGGVKGSICC